MSEYDELEGIAIIGMSGRFPNARTIEEFWKNIADGVESITVLSDADLEQSDVSPAILRNPNFVRACSSLEDAGLFDAAFFGISPSEAEMIDPQQRLFLEYSWAALEHAGYNPETYDREIGVYGGTSMSTYMLYYLSHQSGHVGSIQTVLGNDKDYLCTRVSYKLNLKGPSVSVQTACSTSLAAICMACDSLLDHQCTIALAGGVTVKMPQRSGYVYEKGSILSPDGHCRAFDAEAGGTVFGDGVGVVVLKRLRDAVADRDTIHAVIKGTAVNNDGSVKVGFTAPSIDGQARVIAMAQAMADTPPDTIGFVEAHGTGTPLGDPIEVAALTQAFRAGTSRTGYCAIGSVKTNVGHLESAAGVAGLIKAVLALKHKQLPPSLHFRTPNPEIDFEKSPFYVNTTLVDWKTNGSPRRAGVNSFGMGGTNTHVVLEEAPEIAAVVNELERPRHVLCLSARSEKALGNLAASYEEYLSNGSQSSLADICFTASVGRKHFNHRAAIEAGSTEELLARLRGYRAGSETAGVATGVVSSASEAKIAFLFTGQGSQYAGMGRQLYETQPVFRENLEQCQTLLAPWLKLPLLSVLFAEDEQTAALLDETEYTQPALFALEYSLARMWQSWGVEPAVLLGHSVGEYVAACIGGIFSLEDGLRLIAARGRLMQRLPRDGAMATVFADAARVRKAIEGHSSEVGIAAINGPTNTVISGRAAVVEEICRKLNDVKVRTKPLKVSHAFHSPLIAPMIAEFEVEAGKVKWQMPQKTIISNLTGEVGGAEMTRPEYWCRQVREAVRFGDGARRLVSEGVKGCLEIGPRPALTRMASETEDVSRSGMEMWGSVDGRREDWEVVLETVGRMYANGVGIDWEGYERGYARGRVELPGYPFERQRYWVEGEGGGWEGRSVRREAVEHELAGWRVREAWTEETRYEGELSTESPEYLRDHRVYGEAVVPAAAYLEMMQWATWRVEKGAEVELEGTSFRQAMVLKEGEKKRVQVVVKPEGGGYVLRVYSEEEGRWVLHASGKGRRAEGGETGPGEGESLEEVRSRCVEKVDAEEMYEMYRGRGLEYGEGFRPVKEVWRGEGEAVALLELPERVGAEAGYRLHPVMLDGSLQTLGAIFGGKEQGGGETYLPVGMKRLRVYREPGTTIWVHARISQGAEGAMSADLTLFSEQGDLVAVAHGLESRRATREAVLQSAQEPMENWLYEVDWRPQPVASTDDAHKAGSWLVLADSGGIGDRLSAGLNPRGDSVIFVSRGDSFSQLAQDRYSINPAVSEHWTRLLDAIKAGGARLHGVVSSWSTADVAKTDAPPNPSGEQVKHEIESSCKSTLHLVQALAGAGISPAPRLWILTRGAQAVAGKISGGQLAQTALLGMARVIATEHPQFNCTLIDLDPKGDSNEDVSLVQELVAGSREGEIAFREGRRYVPRLVRLGEAFGEDSDESLIKLPHHGSFELTAAASGDLESIDAIPLVRRPPSRNEIEIEVRALSLNFKDVLNAMKLYPGDAGPLGSECSGVVTAIGLGVENFAVGDEVIVMSPGCFRGHVTVDAHLALKKPASLSFETAATIPVAFLTAYYGLHHLAQLRPGERVLIHAASGGVGMAAIQIAKTIGAEIHATASPAKWDVLRDLGISNLYHSRTLDFADQILAATNGAGVDVILNSLSGEAIAQSFKALSASGRFVEIGKRGIWTDEQVAAAKPDASYFSGDLGEGSVKIPEVLRSLLEEVVAKFDEGTFTELPVTCFPIAKAREAFRLMQQARHIGKVVMTLPAPKLKDVTCDPAGTYLVTGAFGGLGQVIARWLVEKGARNLALVSLRGAREEHEAFLAEISQTAKVRAISADLSRRDEVARVLDEIQLELPPLKGIVHAAGLLADGVLQKQSWDRFEQVIGAKAMRAWHLTELTLGRDLDFFVEFSSVAAVLGNAGQSNYAAANAFLDGLAHFRRGLGVPGLSINWGGWSEVGMAARQMEGYWVSNEMIAPRQGTEILEQLLSRSEAQVAVIPFNWVSYLQQYPINAEPPYLSVMAKEVQQLREGNEQGSILRQQLRRASGARRHEMLLEYMQDLVAKLLRLEATQRPDATSALSDLGLDSLMGIQLKNRIRAELGVDVPIEEFVESPSIGQLTSLLVELVGEMEIEDTALVDNIPPLVRIARTGDIPASFAQQRLWYLEQLDSEMPFYNLSFGIEMAGHLDTGVLKRVIAEIVKRHEILRTTFKVVDGLPMQHIAAELVVPLKVHDLRQYSLEVQENMVKQIALEDALQRFDLSVGPLLDASLIIRSDESSLLGVTMHHIITDGWSMGLFVNEFATLYGAFAAAKESPLPELAVQYADFAVWQRQWLSGEVFEDNLNYWRDKLGGVLPVVDLPVDRPRPAIQSFKGGTEGIQCSPELTAKLNALAKQEGTTLYVILLAAFKALIYRYTGQQDILVGSMVANRTRPEVEQLIGFFANMLAMRTDLTGNPTFRDVIGRVRVTANGAFAHQDLPFEKLVEELQPQRNLNRNPIVQVVLILQQSSFLPSVDLPGLRMRSAWNANDGSVRFDLEVHLWEFEGDVSGTFIYNTDLFDRATIARMTSHFKTLLEGAVDDPEQRIADLQYLGTSEREVLLGMSDGRRVDNGSIKTEGLTDAEVNALLGELLADENDQ